MAPRKNTVRRSHAEAETTIWKEALCGMELLLLHASPVCYGFGVPHGDQSAVIVIPGFLGTDHYLMQLYSWLERIGYRPYRSGIRLNCECPNLLIKNRLNAVIDRALRETGHRVNIIGHSLGGVIARSIAAQRPADVASIITLASPFRGSILNGTVLRTAEAVRKYILQEQGSNVLPNCYTARCTCDFLNHLRCEVPTSVLKTAIYTRDDGIADWRYCTSGDPTVDFEVPGTHIGLVFNSSAYTVIAQRLAEAHSRRQYRYVSRPSEKNGRSRGRSEQPSGQSALETASSGCWRQEQSLLQIAPAEVPPLAS
jgi:pimeloyl-ACP methyl ester carboxylesterase